MYLLKWGYSSVDDTPLLEPPPLMPARFDCIIGVSMGDVKIQNVVASANINQTIHLSSIKKIFLNVEYKPKRFPGLIFRMKRPKTATLIFGSGKMVCTGAKSMKQARSSLRKVVRLLKKDSFIILRKPKITITNVVATTDMGGRVDLEKAVEVMENVMYEPEQFPGIIYRLDKPKVVMLLFASGKTVITGARSEKEAQEAAEKIRATLRDNHLIIIGS